MRQDTTCDPRTPLSWLLLSLVATAVLLGACGGNADGQARSESTAPSASAGQTAAASAPAGPVAACDRRERLDSTESLCIDYIGKANTKSFVEGECGAVGGKLIDACPAEGVIGRCVRWGGTRNEAVEVYYAGGEKVFETCEVTGGTKGS